MLSSSVRRLAISAPPSQIPTYVASTVSRTVATHALNYRRPHQRRHSSSKPSSPADGPKGIAEGQAVPAAPAQSRSDGDKKPAARSTRRKAKDIAANCTVKARDETMQNLPSVPSTHHVKGKGIADLRWRLLDYDANTLQKSPPLPSFLSTAQYPLPQAFQKP